MNHESQININNGSNQYTHLASWRAALAGLFMALLTFGLVTSLSLAFGGVGLDDGASGTNAGIFTGVSFFVAVVLSTMAGAYFAVRMRSNTNVGFSTQSLLVASLVILLLLVQVASAVGALGRVAGNTLGFTMSAAGAGAAAAGQSSMVQDLVEDNLGQMNLKSPPEVVLRGVTSRLVNGNADGAKNYLAAQAGISPEEADQKLTAVRSSLDRAMTQAREGAATALQAAGWTLFGTILLGVLSALLGGWLAFRGMRQASSDEPLTGTRGTLSKAYQS